MALNMGFVCGLMGLLFLVVLFFNREGFAVQDTQPPTIETNFLDESIRSDVIPNAPAPAGTDITGKLIYAPVDLQANIVAAKQKIDNLGLNLPSYIKQEVQEQIFASCPSMKTHAIIARAPADLQ